MFGLLWLGLRPAEGCQLWCLLCRPDKASQPERWDTELIQDVIVPQAEELSRGRCLWVTGGFSGFSWPKMYAACWLQRVSSRYLNRHPLRLVPSHMSGPIPPASNSVSRSFKGLGSGVQYSNTFFGSGFQLKLRIPESIYLFSRVYSKVGGLSQN